LPLSTALLRDLRVSTSRTLRESTLLALAPLLALSLVAAAQTPQAPTPPPTTTEPPADATPHGEVLFQSHGDPPTTPDNTTVPALQQVIPVENDPARSSFSITAYDLDARLRPATSSLAVRARLTVRNISSQPITRVALQISSSLKWESATLVSHTPTVQLTIPQGLLDTDADHTGKVSELILTVVDPIAPGDSVTFDTFYSGVIKPDSTRLERIGASAAQALNTDWDAIGDADLTSGSAPTSPTLSAALRGFGNVLWYPVSTPPLFLGDGAKLFQAVGNQRLTQAATTIHLHLAVEYHSDPPTAAYFCGRRQPLTALPDDPNQPIADGSGIATADFAAEPIGFRLPSLFVLERPEVMTAPLPTPASSSSGVPRQVDFASPAAASMLAVATDNDTALTRLDASVESIAPLLQLWLGAQPLTALTILDHPGEPFQDGPLLVAPVDSLAATSSLPALVHSLTHAWVQTGQPWFDEGLPAFFGLLWTEQQQGRATATAQLADLMQPVSLAEPAFTPPDAVATSGEPTTPALNTAALKGTGFSPSVSTAQNAGASAPEGQPLIAASDDLYYRRKAAAVWWMLRGIAGDEPLIAALTQWRVQPVSHDGSYQQAVAFERLLEKTSGKDLAWFFSDWILRDRGLPDLTLVAAEPRQLPAGKGHNSGYLVAVTVRNDGAAVADVPLIIRSGALSTTARIRIAGFSSITDRIVVEAPPTEVQVNDGTTPEVRASTHTQSITIATQN